MLQHGLCRQIQKMNYQNCYQGLVDLIIQMFQNLYKKDETSRRINNNAGARDVFFVPFLCKSCVFTVFLLPFFITLTRLYSQTKVQEEITQSGSLCYLIQHWVNKLVKKNKIPQQPHSSVFCNIKTGKNYLSNNQQLLFSHKKL